MAIGSGLAASLGVAPESAYGTYTAPTRFYEVDKEDLKKTKHVLQGGGLAAGRLAQPSARRVVSTVGGEGSFDVEVTHTGMGLLLSHLTGAAGTPVQQGVTTAYLQTHTFADNVGKFLTIQKGVPDTGGTVRPYSFLGCKVTGATFGCEVNGLLTATFNIDAKDVTEAQALAAPSYTSRKPFHGGQMAVKLGAVAAEAAITGVKRVEVRMERPQNTERLYAQTAGAPGTKLEPLMNDYIKISGTLEADYVTKADLADRFASDANTSLVIEWVGPLIAATHFETFRIKVPSIFIDSETPTVAGPDIVSTSYAFTGQFDLTNPLCTIEYMSVDTAI